MTWDPLTPYESACTAASAELDALLAQLKRRPRSLPQPLFVMEGFPLTVLPEENCMRVSEAVWLGIVTGATLGSALADDYSVPAESRVGRIYWARPGVSETSVDFFKDPGLRNRLPVYRKTRFKIKEIVASGGALRDSPVWTQIISDVLGRDLKMSGAKESSSRGAVLLAHETTGKIDNIDDSSTANANKTTYHSKCHAIYKLARKQHRVYYESILDGKL